MQTILFITLSNIGDAVMTTPTLERLHQLYPEARIDLICDPRSSMLFEHCPYRGEIFLKHKKAGKKGLWKLIKQLRQIRYDLIVDLRTDGLSYLLRARQRLTKWNRQPYGLHAVEDLISIIHKINPAKTIPDTQLWLTSKEIQKASDLTKDCIGKNWLAIGPGANWAPKTWATENFAKVANDLTQQIDCIIIIGGPADQEKAAKLEKLLKTDNLNLCGKTDLLTTTAVLQQCRLFIGNDSGLGHLAAAVKTPTISVFGPGRPKRYHPWSNANRYIVGSDENMQKISINDVTKAALELLG